MQIVTSPCNEREHTVLIFARTHLIILQMLSDGCLHVRISYVSGSCDEPTNKVSDVFIPSDMKSSVGSTDVLPIAVTSKLVDDSTCVM